MKLLRRNDDVQSWRLHHECDWCRSELEIEASDLVLEAGRSPGYYNYSYTCPACNLRRLLSVTKIPNAVEKHIIQNHSGSLVKSSE